MENEEAIKQAIHELGTAIAWLTQGTVHMIGGDLAGDVISKCEEVERLIE